MIESINNVAKEAARQLDEDEIIVKQLNYFLWKEVRDNIRTGKHTTMWLRGWGMYTISKTKLNLCITKCINTIRKWTREGTHSQGILDEFAELSLLLKRRNDIAIQYKINEDKARAKKHAKLSKTNMGEQAPDITGSC